MLGFLHLYEMGIYILLINIHNDQEFFDKVIR